MSLTPILSEPEILEVALDMIERGLGVVRFHLEKCQQCGQMRCQHGVQIIGHSFIPAKVTTHSKP